MNDLEELLFFNCPNCDIEIIVHKTELNCRIFRHAVYKDTFIQVDPHLPEILCNKLIEENKVIGCCKPFEIIIENKNFVAVKCKYK